MMQKRSRFQLNFKTPNSALTTEAEAILQALFCKTVILSEAKDLLSRAAEESRSFASLRMTE
jgi:hypothetical protein